MKFNNQISKMIQMKIPAIRLNLKYQIFLNSNGSNYAKLKIGNWKLEMEVTKMIKWQLSL